MRRFADRMHECCRIFASVFFFFLPFKNTSGNTGKKNRTSVGWRCTNRMCGPVCADDWMARTMLFLMLVARAPLFGFHLTLIVHTALAHYLVTWALSQLLQEKPAAKNVHNLSCPFLAASAEKEQLQGDQGNSALTSHFAEPHCKRIFNYRLSRARLVIETAFGIMAQKWRILRRPFKAKDDKVRRIISACVLLHNFLLKKFSTSQSAYCPHGTADHLDWLGNITEGSWRAEESSNTALLPLRSTGYHSTRAAYRVRDLLAKYFVTDGEIPWQEYMIKNTTLCSGSASGRTSLPPCHVRMEQFVTNSSPLTKVLLMTPWCTQLYLQMKTAL
ncbi:uncharacterized protein LOC119441345 isoform X2 [Dermacentor silvarum]|uniref:uncharacterized protein LOC119441345 isoform X2 n=1 Tax=Dermacentor silvarum TaxID=543639 RepID=UPI002100A1B7|nr:uncharacterized protein LOC119441345 isoform X2 [Dermacentor silvarum]